MRKYRLHWSLDWDSNLHLRLHERGEGETLWSAFPPRRGSVDMYEHDDERLRRDMELFVLHDTIEHRVTATGREWTFDPSVRDAAPEGTVQAGAWRNGDIIVPVITDAGAPCGLPLDDEDADVRPHGLTLSRILPILRAEGLETANRYDARHAVDLLNADDILHTVARRYIEQLDKEADR